MTETQPNIALVIGINGSPETGLPPLRYAEETAYQVARMLTSPASGFTLHCGEPLVGAAATTDAVRRAIFDARRAASRHGLLLIYYIGHGRYITDASGHSDVFLVTSNFRPEDARDDPSAHLSMEWLQEKVLRHSTPDRLLLILDCCYAGAVGEAAPDPVVDNLRRRLAQALNIQRTDVADGSSGTMRKTLAAVSPWHKAYEGDGATRYSAALLRGLAGAAALEDGRVTWQSLHAMLQVELADAQPGEYGFDRSSGATLAYYPDRARLRTPEHQPFVMPYPPLPNFVGREEELKRLATMLTGEQAEDVALLPAIAGIGGIGKTRLAIEFVHRYRDRFPDGVFWLSMEQPETIETQVAACGGPRGLQLFDDELGEQLRRQTIGFDGELSRFERPRRLSLRERVEQVRAIWEGPGRRLIIFDNLEDPTLLEQWRPRGGGSRLLITTRRQSWKTGSGVRLLPLTSLTDEASLSLLLGPRAIERDRSIADLLADQGEAEAAQDIVRELGGLPLALTLAGRYLAECSMTLARYLEQLRTESINHHSLNAELVEGLPSGQRASIVASFALSYQRLGNDPTDHLARTIWLSAAQLAPEPILDEVLIRAAELDPTDDTQRERGEQALRRLRELGLIEYSDGSHRLHRLLRAYARIVTDDPLADWRRAVRGLGQTVQQLDEKLELSARPFLEHIRQLLDVRVANRDRDQADLLHAAGLIMYQDDDYPTARQYLQEALAIKEAVLGRRHRSTAATLHVLGNVAYAEGDYPTARQYLQEALAITEAVLGRRHRETADTLHVLGNVAHAEGDYPTARQYLQEALAIEEAVLGRRHRSTAVTLHVLGNVAYAEGDYPTARQYLQEALAIKEAVLGRRHRSTAVTLHVLGNVAYAEGDYPTARQYLQEALAIEEAVLGRRHRSTADTLHVLGNVAYAEGDYPTARQYFQEALEITEAVLGRRHRSTAVTLQAMWPMPRATTRRRAVFAGGNQRCWPMPSLNGRELPAGGAVPDGAAGGVGNHRGSAGPPPSLNGRHPARVRQCGLCRGRLPDGAAVFPGGVGNHRGSAGPPPSLNGRHPARVRAGGAGGRRLPDGAAVFAGGVSNRRGSAGPPPSLNGRHPARVRQCGLCRGRLPDGAAVFAGGAGNQGSGAGPQPSLNGRHPARVRQCGLCRGRLPDGAAVFAGGVSNRRGSAGPPPSLNGRHPARVRAGGLDAEGDYPTARQYLQEALAIEEAVLGRRHRETAVTLHVLGKVAYAEGDYPTARQYLQEALAIEEAVLGRRHRETAVTLHELGNVAYAEGDYPTARQYLQEALAIKEAVLGRRHRSTAATLYELGKVAYAEGDYPTARQYWQEALAIEEAVLGRRHRETAVTLHGLGSVAYAEGDYPTARQYWQEALAIKEAVLGRSHRETMVMLIA
jgi:tetratricopeptide (TPR) repeat protein